MVSRWGAILGLALGLGVSLLGSGTAAAVQTTYGTAAVLYGGSDVEQVFDRSPDGGIDQFVYSRSGWADPVEVPGTAGTAASAPATAVYGDGPDLDLFYLDSDGGIDQLYYSPASGQWTGPLEVPGTAGTASSAPTVSVFRSGAELELWYRSVDSGIDEAYYDASPGWSGPTEIPGSANTVDSAPTADVFRSGGQIDLWYRTANGGIDHIFYSDANGFSAPMVVPGSAGSALSAPAVTTDNTYIDLFFQGTDGGVDEIFYSDAGGFSAPAEIPNTAGTSTSAPGAVISNNDTEVDVFYLGTDGNLREVFYTGAANWSGPITPLTAAATAPTSPPTTATIPVPVATTPVSTTVTPPTAGHSARRVRVRISLQWTWNHHVTRLTRVRLSRLPRGARIAVRCTGPGCPKGVIASRRGGVPKLAHALERHAYRSGDRLSIVITAPGRRREHVIARIRDEAKPILSLG